MKNLLKTVLLGAAVTAWVGSASGAPTTAGLAFSDDLGATWITVLDNGAGDVNSLVGGVVAININMPNSTWTVTSATGLSKPGSGTAALPDLDTLSLDVKSGNGTKQLWIKFTDTGFGPGGNLSAFAKIGGTSQPGATVTFETYGDAGNAQFATTTLLTSEVFNIGASGGFNGSAGGAMTGLGNPYSLTELIKIQSGAGNSSFDAELKGVPDGGVTVAMLGFGLLGVEALRRRLSKSSLSA